MQSKTALTHENYARAENFLPWNADTQVYNEHIHPTWIMGKDGIPTERFWYLGRTSRGKEFILVDPEQGSREHAFDHARLAGALGDASEKEQQAYNLPFEELDIMESPNGKVVRFQAGGKTWQCDLSSYQCKPLEPIKSNPIQEVPSPDGHWAAFRRDYNLWIRDMQSGEEFPLTEDGEEHYDYGGTLDCNLTTVTNRRAGREFPASVRWSPDSKKLVTIRVDQRHVKDYYLLQSVPEDGSIRPKLYSYRYQQYNDPLPPLVELIIFDVEQRIRINVDYHPLRSYFFTLVDKNWVWWTQDSQRLYFLESVRWEQELKLCVINPASGETRLVIHEVSQTRAVPNLWLAGRPIAYDLDEGKEIVWFSERDGWGHLYLFDGLIGEVKQRITQGNWVIRDVVRFDSNARIVYFLASGRVAGEDPYYRHLYRVHIDTGEIQPLTPDPGDHSIQFSPSGRYFVDRCGRADGPTVTMLRQADGEVVCTLEIGDFSQLQNRGWRFPEPFRFTGRDGVTDLYGTILFPTDFDPNQKYPVLDDIYGWNQMIHVLKTYPDDGYGLYDYWMPQAMAELGFIVVLMDGMGTPFRSRAFHDISYRNQADGGLPDHILGLRQLAAERPYMDLSRVGIYGHSGGGFSTARALLAYPDFFHVGVSSAGPHDMRLYLGHEDETEEDYDRMDNTRLAGNLRGKLLLVQGELDDNVHPACTLKLVNALIEANADFDLLIQPNCNHNNCMEPYYVRRLWDYFVTHLARKTPPRGYRIARPGGRFLEMVEMGQPADDQD